MSDSDDFVTYASQALERFDTFVSWTTSYWPRPDMPLSVSDFAATRHELEALLLDRLNGSPSAADGNAAGPERQSAHEEGASSEQFVPVTPAPWP